MALSQVASCITHYIGEKGSPSNYIFSRYGQFSFKFEAQGEVPKSLVMCYLKFLFFLNVLWYVSQSVSEYYNHLVILQSFS